MTRLQARRRLIEEIAFATPAVLFLKIAVTIILSRASDSTTIPKQPPPQPPPQQQQPAQRPQQHLQLQRQQLQALLQQLQQRLRRQLGQQRFNQPAEYQSKLNLGFSSNFLKN